MTKQWISKNFTNLLIIALLALLLVKVMGKHANVETVKIVRDTVYIVHQDTVITKPSLVTVIKPVQISQKLLHDTTYIKDSLLSTKIYHDTLRVDSIGEVRITDTIANNSLVAHKFDYNFRERVITNTITKYAKPRNQIYAGGGIGSSPLGAPNAAYVGLLLKNKRDNVLGFNIGYNIDRDAPQYQLSYYLKLQFRR